MVLRLDQRLVQGNHGRVVVFLVNDALHLHLPDRLVDGLDADIRLGQRRHRLGQDALDLEVRADGRDDGDVVQVHLGHRIALLDQADGAGQRLAGAGRVIGDAVGIGVLVHHVQLQLLEQASDLDVVADITEHLLVEYLQPENILAPGDDLHTGLFAAIILADGSAAMVRLEGILDAQLDTGTAQGPGGLGMEGLHAQVGQLVGNIIVGAADGHHLVYANLVRIGARQVIFLVDDGLTGARAGGNLRESDLAIAAVEGIHQTFAAMGIAGGNDQLTAQVDAGEAVGDHVLERLGLALVPAGQINQARTHAVLLQGQYGIESTVRLAQGGEHLAHLHQLAVELEVTVGTQLLQVEHAIAGVVEAAGNKAVGRLTFVLAGKQLGVLRQHAGAYLLQVLQPGVLTVGIGKALVDAGLAALLVLQQQVGHAAVGGDHEDAVVQVAVASLTNENGVQ